MLSAAASGLAKSLMRRAITLGPASTVKEARDTMLRYNISRIVVVASAGGKKVAGMLTEKDIARFLYREPPSRRLDEITVDEVMSRNVVTVGEDAGLKSCARLMLEKGISSMVVVGGKEDKDIQGIFTKSDLADAYVRQHSGEHKVLEFMTKKVWTVAPDEPVHMAMLLMDTHKVSRVIVARNGRPVGIITSRDLLPAGAVFGTGAVGSHWTVRSDLVDKRRQQWYIPSGIKAAFVASDVMTYGPIVTTTDADLADAAYVMLRNRISGLPVVEGGKDGRLAGIVTKTDIVRALALALDGKSE